MCETNAFAVSGAGEELLMESVRRVEVKGDTLVISGVFGDRQEFRGRIIEVNFQSGRLVTERL